MRKVLREWDAGLGDFAKPEELEAVGEVDRAKFRCNHSEQRTSRHMRD